MIYKRIRSLERGIGILQYLNTAHSATAGEIAKHCGLPRPTVHRILDTLVDHGLAYRSPSSQNVYRVTGQIGRLSAGLATREWPSEVGRPILDHASAELNWPVYLATPEESAMLIRESTRGSTLFWIDQAAIGIRQPLLTSAAGIVYAAHCDAALQEEFLSSDDGPAREAVAQARRDGHALVHEEKEPGATSLAVPIMRAGRAVGALGTAWTPVSEPDDMMVIRHLPVLADLRARIETALDRSAAD